MPPKKKTVRNAYFFFMDSYKEDYNSKHPQKTISIKDAASLCSPLWQTKYPMDWTNCSKCNEIEMLRKKGSFMSCISRTCSTMMSMSAEEKKVYEDMAKKEKSRIRGMPEMKYTTTGLKVCEVETKERELLERSSKMRKEIEDTVNSLNEGSFLDKRFYFIHANFFCQCDDGDYIPAEVGVSCFTLRNGIEKYYHSMINPGNLPIGYTYKAQKNSDDTHGIPIPPTDIGEYDFSKIFRDIFTFIINDGDRTEFPPLYTVNEFEAGVTNLLGKLCVAAGRDRIFKVYDLVYLFFTLKNKASHFTGKEGFPVFCLAETEIENDRFAYTKEICCYWHERSEGPQYCSLSRVRRWGFHIADHCCKDLPVQLLPGQHLPTTDKYFIDVPCEVFQTQWQTRKPTVKKPVQNDSSASATASATFAETLYPPLRQPRTMGIALSEALKETPASLEMKEENFPPLGRRLGAKFGNIPK